MESKKIGIIGTGRWASNIAGLCLKNNHQVIAWERKKESQGEFFKTGINSYIDLSSFKQDKQLLFTTSLNKIIQTSDVVFISILSQYLNDLMQNLKQVKGYQNTKYCLAMKGVESSTGRTLSEIMMDNGVRKENIAVLGGPGHIQNIVANKKTHMSVAAYKQEFAKEIQNILTNKNFKLFIEEDVKGLELCAAAKNPYGILAGVCVGSGNETLRGSLMCASLLEMGQYLDAMQCLGKTASGLPLLGDFDATMYDSNSHNLNYGIQIVKQNTANPKVDFVPEGKQAVQGLIKRMIQHNNEVSDFMQLNAPLLQTCNDIVEGKIKPAKAVEAVDKAIQKVRDLYN